MVHSYHPLQDMTATSCWLRDGDRYSLDPRKSRYSHNLSMRAVSVSTRLTAQHVSELLMANRAIRAPYYSNVHDEDVQSTDLYRELGEADTVPALLGLFRVERDPRDDHPDGWFGVARHWRGGTLPGLRPALRTRRV